MAQEERKRRKREVVQSASKNRKVGDGVEETDNIIHLGEVDASDIYVKGYRS